MFERMFFYTHIYIYIYLHIHTPFHWFFSIGDDELLIGYTALCFFCSPPLVLYIEIVVISFSSFPQEDDHREFGSFVGSQKRNRTLPLEHPNQTNRQPTPTKPNQLFPIFRSRSQLFPSFPTFSNLFSLGTPRKVNVFVCHIDTQCHCRWKLPCLWSRRPFSHVTKS